MWSSIRSPLIYWTLEMLLTASWWSWETFGQSALAISNDDWWRHSINHWEANYVRTLMLKTSCSQYWEISVTMIYRKNRHQSLYELLINFLLVTHSTAVTAINVDVVLLSCRLITSLRCPLHSSHIKAITWLHAPCLTGPPGWFWNVLCLPLQISIKAECWLQRYISC